MKNFVTFNYHKSKFHLIYSILGILYLGLKRITRLMLIITIILTTAFIIPAQNVKTQNALDAYKNFYIWKEKENSFPVSDSVLTVLGRWAWGPCHAVDVKDNYAYIGNGPTLHVLDLSEPSSPEIVGEYLTDGYVYDIELKYEYAFICIGRGLLILSITNPLKPEKVSEITLGGIAISFALEDDFAYVTTFSGVMWLVELSDIDNPFVRNVIAAGGQLAFCVEAKDGYVYIGNPEWPPMVMVDATNPDSLTRVDFEVGGWGYSANIKDTLLFVGVHGYYGTNYLKIYNVSNPAEPQFFGGVVFVPPEDVMAITVSEDVQTTYVRTTTGNIYSIDISILTQPEIIDKYEKKIGTIFGHTGIAFSNNLILSAHYIGLLTLDGQKPDSLMLRSFFPTGGTALEMDSKDSLVFVACGLSGLWILNISNPMKPQTVSNVMVGGFTADLVVEDTLAYIVNWAAYSDQDTSRGLWIIDISDIDQPNIVSHYKGIANFSTNTTSNSISKSANLIFITQQPRTGIDSILEIIDVNNIYEPQGIGILVSKHYPRSCSIKDSILFLATRGAGLRILNIKNPIQPKEINIFSDSSYISTSDVYDNLLYADRTDKFFILDISNPVEPQILGELEKSMQGSALNIEATKKYVYLASLYLRVIDISDKANPIEIAQFGSRDYGRDVTAIGDKIFFSDGTQGIWVIKNHLVTSIKEHNSLIIKQYKLYQNYPNPFNPFTIIEFEIPQKEKVYIEIFDLLGRKIKTILSEELEKGYHKVEFNAVGLSSGIYFYRMKTKETVVTKKMVVLR